MSILQRPHPLEWLARSGPDFRADLRSVWRAGLEGPTMHYGHDIHEVQAPAE